MSVVCLVRLDAYATLIRRNEASVRMASGFRHVERSVLVPDPLGALPVVEAVSGVHDRTDHQASIDSRTPSQCQYETVEQEAFLPPATGP